MVCIRNPSRSSPWLLTSCFVMTVPMLVMLSSSGITQKPVSVTERDQDDVSGASVGSAPDVAEMSEDGKPLIPWSRCFQAESARKERLEPTRIDEHAAVSATFRAVVAGRSERVTRPVVRRVADGRLFVDVGSPSARARSSSSLSNLARLTW